MKKILILILAAAVSLSLAGCDFFGATTTTTPVPTLPDSTVYPIGSAAELAAIHPDKNYILTADIDLNGVEWIPIGDSQTPYSGTFDGDGNQISDFKITAENDGYVGLFGNVTGDILNLNLDEVLIEVTATRMIYVGVLAGFTTGNVSSCNTRGIVSIHNPASSTYAGLLVGVASSPITVTTTALDFEESVLVSSHSTGFLEVASQTFAYVGGLIGKAYNVELDGCFSTSDITVSSETGRIYAGGLVGHNYGGILVGFEEDIERETYLLTRECVARSKIVVASRGTKASVGGLYGYDNYGHLEKCAAFLEVSGSGLDVALGGISGENWNEDVLHSAATIAADITSATGQTLAFGGISGFLKDPDTIQNSFYLVHSASVPTATGGTAATVTDFGTASWYSDTLLWDDPLDAATIVWATRWLTKTAFEW